MKKTLAAAALLALASLASAQTSTANTSAIGSAQSNPTGNGVVTLTLEGAQAPSPMTRQTIESTGSSSLRTNAPLNLPGIYNASGTYNCFGAASVGASGLWGSVGGGVTVDKDKCYRLHLMDKAANRSSAAAQAGATSEAVAYKKVWEAGFCAFEDGAEMFKAAGMECPQDEQKRISAERGRAVSAMQTNQDLPADWRGANLSDPTVAARAARAGVFSK